MRRLLTAKDGSMFGQTIPAKWTYTGPAIEEAVSRLVWVAEQGQPFVLLQGGRSVGKSTVLSLADAECRAAGLTTIRLNTAALDLPAFLHHLAGALSIVPAAAASAVDLMGLIRDEISGRAVCDQKLVVLLDDLHLTITDAEPMLRFLMALNQLTDGAVCVLATASEEIPAGIADLSELRVMLEPYRAEHALEFVLGSLQQAAITDDGVASIVEYGGGLPGRMTRACEMVKVALEADPTLLVDRSVVTALTQETLLADVA